MCAKVFMSNLLMNMHFISEPLGVKVHAVEDRGTCSRGKRHMSSLQFSVSFVFDYEYEENTNVFWFYMSLTRFVSIYIGRIAYFRNMFG